jgi:ATP-dependent Clp protease ATP-binding subunit ClpC
MTSNIGTRQLKDFGHGVGFQTESRMAQANAYSKSIIENALKKTFAPEFLNRIDDVVLFNALSKIDISKVIDIELKGLFDRVKAMGYAINIVPEAKNFLCEKGFDPNFGARPLKRAIQKYLENPMAEVLIKHQPTGGETIRIGFDSEKEELTFEMLSADETYPVAETAQVTEHEESAIL